MEVKDIADYIRNRCKEVGGQSVLAERTGLSIPYVNDLVNGRRMPGPRAMAALGFSKRVVYEAPPLKDSGHVEYRTESFKSANEAVERARRQCGAKWILGNPPAEMESEFVAVDLLCQRPSGVFWREPDCCWRFTMNEDGGAWCRPNTEYDFVRGIVAWMPHPDIPTKLKKKI